MLHILYDDIQPEIQAMNSSLELCPSLFAEVIVDMKIGDTTFEDGWIRARAILQRLEGICSQAMRTRQRVVDLPGERDALDRAFIDILLGQLSKLQTDTESVKTHILEVWRRLMNELGASPSRLLFTTLREC
jgi:hypothetical protein